MSRDGAATRWRTCAPSPVFWHARTVTGATPWNARENDVQLMLDAIGCVRDVDGIMTPPLCRFRALRSLYGWSRRLGPGRRTSPRLHLLSTSWWPAGFVAASCRSGCGGDGSTAPARGGAH